MTSTPISLGRRPALDGLRGIAVLLVVAVHLSLLGQGYVGVDIFLVLSGFLITALMLEEHERAGRISLAGFCERRARRLLPALAMLLAVFAMLVLTLDPYPAPWSLGRLLATTWTFANNWVATLAPKHGEVLGPLLPTWTLGQEVQFYVLWSITLVVALRVRLRERSIVLLVAVLIAGLLAGAEYLRHASAVYDGYMSPLDRGGELLLGCGAAIVWRRRWVPALLCSGRCAWLAAGGLAAIVADTGLDPRWSYLSAAALSAWLIVSLLAPLSPGREGEPILVRCLSWRPLRYTGKVSYGIYLYHLPVYYLLWHYVPGHSHPFYAPIVLAATLMLATMSFRAIESPALRLGRQGRRPPRVAAARRRLRPPVPVTVPVTRSES